MISPSCSQLLAALLLLPLIFSAAYSRSLRLDKNPDCPDVGYTEYFSDDTWGGLVFAFTINCDGTNCLRPFTGPLQPPDRIAPITPELPIELPTNIHELERQALRITEPGAELPIYFTDATGNIWRARNCYPGEYSSLYQRYLELADGGDGTASASATPVRTDEGELAILRGLASRYLDYWAPLYTGPDYIDADGLRESGRVMRLLSDNLSGVMTKGLPSTTNGQTLTVVPVAPPFAGPITVSAADGRVVWRGECPEQGVAIGLGNEPAGLYFVSGSGRSLVVTIVH